LHGSFFSDAAVQGEIRDKVHIASKPDKQADIRDDETYRIFVADTAASVHLPAADDPGEEK